MPRPVDSFFLLLMSQVYLQHFVDETSCFERFEVSGSVSSVFQLVSETLSLSVNIGFEQQAATLKLHCVDCAIRWEAVSLFHSNLNALDGRTIVSL